MNKNNNWNLLDYLYYRATLFYSKSETHYGFDDNKRRGSYTVGIFVSLNIESILMLILIFFFKKNTFLIDYMGFVIIGVFLLIIFYSIYILERKRHNLIFNNYKNELPQQKRNRGKILFVYILFTIILLFTVVILGREFWN